MAGPPYHVKNWPVLSNSRCCSSMLLFLATCSSRSPMARASLHLQANFFSLIAMVLQALTRWQFGIYDCASEFRVFWFRVQRDTCFSLGYNEAGETYLIATVASCDGPLGQLIAHFATVVVERFFFLYCAKRARLDVMPAQNPLVKAQPCFRVRA